MDALKLMIDTGVLHGNFDPNKVSGLSPEWFVARQVDFLDFRGDLRIKDQVVLLGRHVRIITASHSIAYGEPSPEIAKKRVWIEKGAFIGSYALLYNCILGENCVVNCGSVVSNVVIPPFTMVEGNPAKIIGRYVNGMWREVECPPYAGRTGHGMRIWE